MMISEEWLTKSDNKEAMPDKCHCCDKKAVFYLNNTFFPGIARDRTGLVPACADHGYDMIDGADLEAESRSESRKLIDSLPASSSLPDTTWD